MKTKPVIFLIISAITLVSSVLFFSCDKSDPPSQQRGFTWTFRDSVYKAQMDTAWWSGMSDKSIIVAGNGRNLSLSTPIPRVAIALVSLDKGTYSLEGVNGNKLYYTDKEGNEGNGGPGTLTITESSGNSISGNFSATVNLFGVNFPITGSFVNTPIR